MNADIKHWKSTGRISLNIHPGFCDDADVLQAMHDRQSAGQRLVLVRHHGGGPEDFTRGGLRPDYYTLESDGYSPVVGRKFESADKVVGGK